MAISSFGFGGSNVHCLVAGAVRPAGPPPRPLPPPPYVEAGPEPVEGGTETAAPLLCPEVRFCLCELAHCADSCAGQHDTPRRRWSSRPAFLICLQGSRPAQML